MVLQSQTFTRAQVEFCRAALAADREVDDARDRAIARIDEALDAYLGAPSPTPRAFADKLRALEAEYGCNWQPRHISALMADVGILAD